MSYRCEVLADSISPGGVRLTTLQVTYPHAIHKDIMTHRMLSRNFQSFRAFPPEKVIEMIKDDPFIPEAFAVRVAGMGQGAALDDDLQRIVRDKWVAHIQSTLDLAQYLLTLDIAKSQINFLLQDFTWITGIITATEWDNFWALRLDTDENGDPRARPEVYKIAQMMTAATKASRPHPMHYGEWHLPLVYREDYDALGAAHRDYGDYCGDWETLKKISVGRCARVSYLTHDGKRDPQKDVELHDGLLQNGHLSPFEHVATPAPEGHDEFMTGNFSGWSQYRKTIRHEDNYGRMLDALR